MSGIMHAAPAVRSPAEMRHKKKRYRQQLAPVPVPVPIAVPVPVPVAVPLALPFSASQLPCDIYSHIHLISSSSLLLLFFFRYFSMCYRVCADCCCVRNDKR